jgi:enoyl-CoA hydratase/carnithine racemase
LISAEEAARIGLVSKVFSPEELLPAALQLAERIAQFSLPVVQMAKEAVNKCMRHTARACVWWWW